MGLAPGAVAAAAVVAVALAAIWLGPMLTVPRGAGEGSSARAAASGDVPAPTAQAGAGTRVASPLPSWWADSPATAAYARLAAPAQGNRFIRVPRVDWSGKPSAFAPQVASRVPREPVVITNTILRSQWQAFESWTPAALVTAASASGDTVLTGAYATNASSGVFGPYYDSRRPLDRVSSVSSRANYNADATVSFARVLLNASDSREHNIDPRARFTAFNGPVESLGPQLLEDVQPLDELIRIDPSKTSVNVWMGQRGVTTPCHYDGYHNQYVQIVGTKTFILAPPAAWRQLRPFPFLHPSHAQCQTVLRDTSHGQSGLPVASPRVATNVTFRIAQLQPGDVLYIPPQWFHEVVATSVSVSVNGWVGTREEAAAERLFAITPPFSRLPWDAKPKRVARVLGTVVAAVGAAVLAVRPDPKAPLPWTHVRSVLRDIATARYGELFAIGELPACASFGPGDVRSVWMSPGLESLPPAPACPEPMLGVLKAARRLLRRARREDGANGARDTTDDGAPAKQRRVAFVCDVGVAAKALVPHAGVGVGEPELWIGNLLESLVLRAVGSGKGHPLGINGDGGQAAGGATAVDCAVSSAARTVVHLAACTA